MCCCFWYYLLSGISNLQSRIIYEIESFQNLNNNSTDMTCLIRSLCNSHSHSSGGSSSGSSRKYIFSHTYACVCARARSLAISQIGINFRWLSRQNKMWFVCLSLCLFCYCCCRCCCCGDLRRKLIKPIYIAQSVASFICLKNVCIMYYIYLSSRTNKKCIIATEILFNDKLYIYHRIADCVRMWFFGVWVCVCVEDDHICEMGWRRWWWWVEPKHFHFISLHLAWLGLTVLCLILIW